MSSLRVLLLLGTRPEAIKMAPVYWALRAADRTGNLPAPSPARSHFIDPTAEVASLHHDRPNGLVEPLVVLSGQHPGMVEPLLEYFGLPIDARCNVFSRGQSPAQLSARLLEELDCTVDHVQPHCMVVQGDTATAHAGALVAHWRKIPLVHVEAGLRSGNLNAPWPEEANRRVIDMLADLCCAPTQRAGQILLREGIDPLRVHVTGNTVVDALHYTLRRERAGPSFDRSKYAFLDDRPFVLVTCHRRENLPHGITRVCLAVDTLAERFADHWFLWFLHPNPRARSAPERMLAGRDNVRLLPPAPYPEFVWLMDRAKLLISDSGGVQEEAPSLGKPVVVTRQSTERIEAVQAGAALLAGTLPQRVVEITAGLLSNRAACARCNVAANPFGDGHAGRRIASLIGRRAWEQQEPLCRPQPRATPAAA